MSKRKNETPYPGDPKRYPVLPDFSVPPPGFPPPGYKPPNFPQSWLQNPVQQPYGYYNYNSSETTPSFPGPSTSFPWNGNQSRTFQNGQSGRQSSNIKNRGRGRGRGGSRLSEPFNSKSPRNTASTSSSTWTHGSSSVGAGNMRYSGNSFSGEQERTIEIIDDKTEMKKTIVNKKGKRKSMSQKYSSKPWDLESAEKAVAVELEYNRLQNTQSLILKFPDAELNKDIVKTFSSSIEHVHFQQPSTPRYCFVQLCEGADVDEVQNQLKEVTFGGGKITVERKTNQKTSELAPEKIDPYTLYVGNLPTNITADAVKAIYPTAFRVDIGYAQKMKYTRYAFISYQSAEAAIKAFKDTHSLSVESRSIIVRFRRHKGAVGLPGQSKATGDQTDEAIGNSRSSVTHMEHKPKLQNMSEDDDVVSVEINDGPVEIDEDDYDFPYNDDDLFDFDNDSIFDQTESRGRESNMSHRSEDPRQMNKSHLNMNSPRDKNSTRSNITEASSSLHRRKISVNSAAKRSKMSNDSSADLDDSVLARIKQEPPERDELDELLDAQIDQFTEELSQIKSEPSEDIIRNHGRLMEEREVPLPIPITLVKAEPDDMSSMETAAMLEAAAMEAANEEAAYEAAAMYLAAREAADQEAAAKHAAAVKDAAAAREAANKEAAAAKEAAAKEAAAKEAAAKETAAREAAAKEVAGRDAAAKEAAAKEAAAKEAAAKEMAIKKAAARESAARLAAEREIIARVERAARETATKKASARHAARGHQAPAKQGTTEEANSNRPTSSRAVRTTPVVRVNPMISVSPTTSQPDQTAQRNPTNRTSSSRSRSAAQQTTSSRQSSAAQQTSSSRRNSTAQQTPSSRPGLAAQRTSSSRSCPTAHVSPMWQPCLTAAAELICRSCPTVHLTPSNRPISATQGISSVTSSTRLNPAAQQSPPSRSDLVTQRTAAHATSLNRPGSTSQSAAQETSSSQSEPADGGTSSSQLGYATQLSSSDQQSTATQQASSRPSIAARKTVTSQPSPATQLTMSNSNNPIAPISQLTTSAIPTTRTNSTALTTPGTSSTAMTPLGNTPSTVNGKDTFEEENIFIPDMQQASDLDNSEIDSGALLLGADFEENADDFHISHLINYVTQENAAFEALHSDENRKQPATITIPDAIPCVPEDEGIDFSEDEEDTTDYTALFSAPSNLDDFLNRI